MTPVFSLRRARPSDCDVVWSWLGDPEVRAAAFSSEAIPLDTHRRWFSARLTDPDTVYLIAEALGGEPMGQVRFQLREAAAEASIVVAKPYRGQGLGSLLLKAASAKLFETTRAVEIHALVRADNPGSRAAFLRAGYAPSAEETVRGLQAERLTLRRSLDG